MNCISQFLPLILHLEKSCKTDYNNIKTLHFMQVTLEKTGELEGRIKVDVVQDDYIAKVNQEL